MRAAWLSSGTLSSAVISGIGAVNVAVFLASRRDASVYAGLTPDGAKIDSGEVWRCATSLVAHRGLAHLAINNALLVVVTPSAVRRLGGHRFLAVYVVGGTSANALRYAAGGRHGGGASGAIVAVASAGAVVALLDRGVAMPAAAVASAAILAVGLVAAHDLSDNHVLAAGIGAAVATSAATPRGGWVQAAGAIGAVALAAMGARTLLGR